MNELLREAFRHNTWATKTLITACRELTPEQLDATTTGTYGSVLATLTHLVCSDAAYLPRAKVQRPDWAGGDDVVVSLDELEARVDETAPLWEAYLDDPLDATDLIVLDEGAYEAQSCVPIVQALHHGNTHREQVCAILTVLGFDAPDLQAWAWAEATGRAKELRPQDA